jgi:arginyl-tRNA synthetase
MQTIKNQLTQLVSAAVKNLWPEHSENLVLEQPKLPEHGDWACTLALQLAKKIKQSPRDVAQALQAHLVADEAFLSLVQSVDIAGPGFLNFKLKNTAKQQVVAHILTQAERYGQRTQAAPKKVLVEFVSANPTGPLHVGHGRQAALGDAICKLYASQGHAVHREFYYNDAGAQINKLALSTQLRAQGLKPGDPTWPEDAYNGEYIDDIAQDYKAKKTVVADDRSCQADGDVGNLEGIKAFAVAYLRNEQDLDLKAFAVRFDHYYLESSLYSSGRVAATVEALQAKGATYESEGALWLKTTAHGDDKDRVMRKSDGGYTYFVPDVAYHVSKWERGFAQVINIQGSDHHGTVARVRAGLQALDVGIPLGYPSYVLHTMVRVTKGGEEVKISKRAGSYVTLRDLIEWTSKDAVRFFLLSRKADTDYVFDVDLAIAKNNDNPVYYVQYAHARIQSVLRHWGGAVDTLRQANVSPLTSPQALHLMHELAQYPDLLSTACQAQAPHELTFYLRKLAAAYHSFYAAERILVDDEAAKLANVALVAACAQVIRNGLEILGVSAPEQM